MHDLPHQPIHAGEVRSACRREGTALQEWWSWPPTSFLKSKITPRPKLDLLYRLIPGGGVRLLTCRRGSTGGAKW